MGSGSADQSQDEEMDNSAVSEGSTRRVLAPKRDPSPTPKRETMFGRETKGNCKEALHEGEGMVQKMDKS